MLQKSGPAYIRVLGADARGAEILRRMRSVSSLPVLGKAPSGTGGAGEVLARIERTASDLWEEIAERYSPGEEKKRHTLITECFQGEDTSP